MRRCTVRIAAACILVLARWNVAAAGQGAEPELVAAAWPDSAIAPWRPPVHGIASIARPTGGTPLAGSFSVGAGSLRIIDSGRSIVAGRADGRLQLPLRPGLAVELRAGLLALDRAAVADRRAMRNEIRLRAGEGSRQVWLGLAVEQDLSGERPRSSPLLVLGGTARARAIDLAASVVQTVEPVRITRMVKSALSETLITAETTVEFSTATSALLSGRWEHRRLALGTMAGVTLDPQTAPRWWSQVSASVSVRPRLAVFGTVGKPAPRWLVSGAGVDRGASLGLRLTSWVNDAAAAEARRAFEPAWRLKPLGEDWHVIEIRVRSARAVSVIGDFTDWQPLALRHVSGSRWALAVRMAPGVHQVQVSVDGGPWQPPGGLSTTADGFSGAVGVFVAE